MKLQRVLLVLAAVSVVITALSLGESARNKRRLEQTAEKFYQVSYVGDRQDVELIDCDPSLIPDEDRKEHWQYIINILYNSFDSYDDISDFKPEDQVAYIFSDEEAEYYSGVFNVDIVPNVKYINSNYYRLSYESGR